MSSLNTSTNEVNETKINIDHIEHPERPDDEDSDSEHQKIIEKLKEEFKKVKEIEIETKDDDGILEVPKKGVIGLNNMGNTCYLNAMLQILSNLDDFRTYLFDGNFVGALKGELDDSLFYQTFRIIKHLWESSADSLSPKSFKNKFVQKEMQFMGFNQQDSHEALHFLLDILHEEIAQPIDIDVTIEPELGDFFNICDQFYNNEGEKNKDLLKIIDANKEKTLDYFAMKYYNNLSKSYSEVADMFQSVTCDLLQCPDCEHIKYNFNKQYITELCFPNSSDEKIKSLDAYETLHAKVKDDLKEKTTDDTIISKLCINEIKNKYVYKLDDLLHDSQKIETLDSDNLWFCENCEKKVAANKQHKIYKNPKYLVIHFKRFESITINGNTNIVKLKNLVGYNEQIDIADLMIRPTENTKYEIVGGINHMGEYAFGHYTCFAKNNNKWYNFNDDSVNELNCNGIPLSQHAYMLIYKMIEPDVVEAVEC
jgi:ubiquitin C-terminal hydrolase